MEKIKVLSRTKEDYKDLESFLIKNDLIDKNAIWFAGYDDSLKSTRHAVAANVFTGYSKLNIISLSGDIIFYLKNSKDGFNVYELAKVSEKNKVGIRRHIIYPSVEVHTEHGDSIYIKVIKNKSSIKAFKKTVK